MSEIKTIDELIANVLEDISLMSNPWTPDKGPLIYLCNKLIYKLVELKRNMEKSVKEIVMPSLIEKQQEEFLEKWGSITVTQPDTKTLQHDNQWISVKDRLPRKDLIFNRVLLLTAGGLVTVGNLVSKQVLDALKRLDDYDFEETSTGDIIRPTHWMPKPAPPEADDE